MILKGEFLQGLNFLAVSSKKLSQINFKILPGIGEALIMHISTTSMYKLAVKRNKTMKI